MSTYLMPTNASMIAVLPEKIARLTADRPIFEYFPMVDVDRAILLWEQRDKYTGFQQLRGVDGAPSRVKAIGGSRFTMEPGYYGEFSTIDENQLVGRRAYGDLSAAPVNVMDLVAERQDQLLQRELDLIEYILWTLVVAGTFTISGPTGVAYIDAYTTKTASGSAWNTASTGTPLADFRAVQLLGRGTSNSYDGGAVAMMNRKTANAMLKNTNAADLGGKRMAAQSNVLSIKDANTILEGEGLPQVQVYDEGYFTDADTATFVPFIADNKIVVFGRRPGNASIGQYAKTRNAVNAGNAPGSYSKVVFRPDDVPPLPEVHQGHNGGVELWYPGAICILTVT